MTPFQCFDEARRLIYESRRARLRHLAYVEWHRNWPKGETLDDLWRKTPEASLSYEGSKAQRRLIEAEAVFRNGCHVVLVYQWDQDGKKGATRRMITNLFVPTAKYAQELATRINGDVDG